MEIRTNDMVYAAIANRVRGGVARSWVAEVAIDRHGRPDHDRQVGDRSIYILEPTTWGAPR